MADTSLSVSPHTPPVAIAKYGDWISRRINDVFENMFRHNNKDGTTFKPRIARACTFWPFYHFVEMDSQALWHFRHDQLTHPNTLAAMTAHVGRPVRPLTVLPPVAPGLPTRSGLAYVVSLMDLFSAQAKPLPEHIVFQLGHTNKGAYMIPIGVGSSGDTWRSLPQLGHILVGGTTGSGKSNWLQAILIALVSAHTPEQVQLILIDPKTVEFSYWASVPYLLGPIATDLKLATRAAESLTAEINRRLALFGEVSPPARDLDSYNRRANEPLPRIIVIVDEFLDLAEEGGQNSELYRLLIRQANRARAVGVTFVLSATNPKAEVINTSLRSACTTRLAFRCTEARQSRAILESSGAESIPASIPGRFLARLPDLNGLHPFQAYEVGDNLLQRVAQALQKPQLAISQAEAALAKYAIEQLGGDFPVRKLWEAFRMQGWSHHQVSKLAQRWERKGWLTAPTNANEARRVTDVLRSIINEQIT